MDFELLKLNTIKDYIAQADNLHAAAMHPKQRNFEAIDAEYERITSELKFVMELFELLG